MYFSYERRVNNCLEKTPRLYLENTPRLYLEKTPRLYLENTPRLYLEKTLRLCLEKTPRLYLEKTLRSSPRPKKTGTSILVRYTTPPPYIEPAIYQRTAGRPSTTECPQVEVCGPLGYLRVSVQYLHKFEWASSIFSPSYVVNVGFSCLRLGEYFARGGSQRPNSFPLEIVCFPDRIQLFPGKILFVPLDIHSHPGKVHSFPVKLQSECTELEIPPERRDHQSPKVTRLTSSRPRMAQSYTNAN
jgi:hypothetical protein